MQTTIGRFTYAGGLELRAAGGIPLGGLSDIAFLSGDRFAAVADEGGQLLFGRLVVDPSGRLVGVADVEAKQLLDADRKPLVEKVASDAEGLAALAGGDWLVSFERRHRIWLYPARGGAPTAAPMPQASFPDNEGVEALAAYPTAGRDAYLVGAEQSGQMWLCRLSGACRETSPRAPPADGFGLTAIATYGRRSVALLYRAFEPEIGNTIVVRLIDDPMTNAPIVNELTLRAPLTRDNFEGLAAVMSTGGALRLFLLSDDNFSETQHTYLMAFDWKR
jgi:hypothetical protein